MEDETEARSEEHEEQITVDPTQMEESEVDPEEIIQRFPRDVLGPDEIHDLLRAAEYVGHTEIAGRLEIERRRLVLYENILATFTYDEIAQIGMVMDLSTHKHVQVGDDIVADRIGEITGAMKENVGGEQS